MNHEFSLHINIINEIYNKETTRMHVDITFNPTASASLVSKLVQAAGAQVSASGYFVLQTLAHVVLRAGFGSGQHVSLVIATCVQSLHGFWPTNLGLWVSCPASKFSMSCRCRESMFVSVLDSGQARQFYILLVSRQMFRAGAQVSACGYLVLQVRPAEEACFSLLGSGGAVNFLCDRPQCLLYFSILYVFLAHRSQHVRLFCSQTLHVISLAERILCFSMLGSGQARWIFHFRVRQPTCLLYPKLLWLLACG